MVTKAQVTALTAVGAVAFSVGGTLGYFLGKRRPQEVVTVEKFIYRQLDDQLDEMQPDGDGTKIRVIRSGQFRDLSVVSDEGFPGSSVTLADAAPQESVVNLLTIPDADWDYDAELSTRQGDIPYIIHRDEFVNDEKGFKQSTLTYYKGDNMVCDELDHLLYNFSHYIGHNLAFGHGSGDPNVFYVRNEKERMEWEVLLDEGRYEVVVLGLEIEHDYEEQDLKHSVRRFVMD